MIWDGIPNREREKESQTQRQKDKKRDRQTERERERERQRQRETRAGIYNGPTFVLGHLYSHVATVWISVVKRYWAYMMISDKVYSTKHRCYCAGEQK